MTIRRSTSLVSKMKTQTIFAAAIALTCLAATSALAGQDMSTSGANAPLLLPALSASELSGLSGGASPAGVAVTNQTLSATNVGNSVDANTVITGEVTLRTGAFNGFNGIGNFVFNTGNNNNLQGTLSVTVFSVPGG